MARPVEGFQAFDGAFFSTEQEASLYEARINLDNSLRTAIQAYVTDTTVVNFLIEKSVYFIYHARSDIEAYYAAKPSEPAAPPIHDIREAVVRSGLERSGDDPEPGTEQEIGGETHNSRGTFAPTDEDEDFPG